MSSICCWAACKAVAAGSSGLAPGRPAKVSERSVPHCGQQGSVLSRGGGREGMVRVMVVDMLKSVWLGWRSEMKGGKREEEGGVGSDCQGGGAL